MIDIAEVDPREQRIIIIGAGPAGLITAKVLLGDGFKDVIVITKDAEVGGVWAKSKIYPGLTTNSIREENHFSCLDFVGESFPEGTMTGEAQSGYYQEFANKFIDKKYLRLNTEVRNIRRPDGKTRGWILDVIDTVTGTTSQYECDRLALCSGANCIPRLPEDFMAIPDPDSPQTQSRRKHFKGGISLHSSQLGPSFLDRIPSSGTILIAGIGKSAKDIAQYLAGPECQAKGKDYKVVVVYSEPTWTVAAKNGKPVPDFIRKSRFLSIFWPYPILRTRIERFLHKTTIGAFIVKKFWSNLERNVADALQVKRDDPLLPKESIFWKPTLAGPDQASTNEFHALIHSGRISVISPARITGATPDGEQVQLSNGKTLKADVVIFATGFSSSWRYFRPELQDRLGLSPRPRAMKIENPIKHYKSLVDPPREPNDLPAPVIYRGIVPLGSIEERDLAVNGAVWSSAGSMQWEIIAHWISSYFLGDIFLKVPSREQALRYCEERNEWLRARHPKSSMWKDHSFNAEAPLFGGPNYCDELLADMGLETFRGCKGFFWFLQRFDIANISNLAAERRERRLGDKGSVVDGVREAI